jgi:hypothetical protein
MDRSRIVSFAVLHRYLAAGHLPRFTWIRPTS